MPIPICGLYGLQWRPLALPEARAGVRWKRKGVPMKIRDHVTQSRRAAAFLLLVASVLFTLSSFTGAETQTLPTLAANPVPDQSSRHMFVTPLTAVKGWSLARQVDANDTLLAASTNVWSSVKTKLVDISGYNTISIGVIAYGDGTGGGDPNGGTFTMRVRLGKRYGPAQLACTATWSVGELLAEVNPASDDPNAAGAYTNAAEDHKWCEGPPSVTSCWMTTCGASGTTNDVGLINIDAMGFDGLYPEITAMHGITSLFVFITGR